MELTNQSLTHESRPRRVICLTHSDKELRWESIEHSNSANSMEDALEVFEHINKYWATRDQQWQDQAFGLYCQIHQIMDEEGNAIALMQQLQPVVAQLLDMHDLSQMRYWVDFYSGVLIPQDPYLKERYEEPVAPIWTKVAEEEDNGAPEVEEPPAPSDDEDEEGEGEKRPVTKASWTRDKTYTIEDYRSFVTLSILMRAMTPIWGEFIFLTKNEFKSWKEFYAFQLISHAQVSESPAMERLRSYVQAMMPPEKDLFAAILDGGLSTSDAVEWLLAMIVIRKATTVDVRGLPQRPSAIASISTYLKRWVTNWNTKLSTPIKNKTPEVSVGDQDNKHSQFEIFRIVQHLSTGTLYALEFELHNPVRVAQGVWPGVDLKLLDQALQTIRQISGQGGHNIHEPQRLITEWLIDDYLPSRALKLMKPTPVLNAIAIAQTILWQWGYKELAILLTASEQRNRLEMSQIHAGPSPKVPKEMVAELDLRFPYQHPVNQRKNQPREANPAMQAINLVHSGFRKNEWLSNIHPEWMQAIGRAPNERKHVISPDLKLAITSLAIRLAEKPTASN